MTGFTVSVAAVDINRRYSFAVVAVNDPLIELIPIIPKERLEGCEAGTIHAGKPEVVVALSLSGLLVKYFGPPLHILFTEKVKK